MTDILQKTILVTGAAGGLGRTLCRIFNERGFSIKALIRPEDDFRELAVSGEDLIRGYVEDPETVSRAMQGVGKAIHCAALLPYTHARKKDFYRVNVKGALNVLQQAARQSVAKVVFFSTISVVDHLHQKPTPDDLCRYIQTEDPYLASKIELEKELKKASQHFQGDIAIIRPAFIYGPDHVAVWKEALDLVAQGKMKLIGKGDAKLPLVAAEDIASFILTGLGQNGGGKFQIHVLANPEPTTMKQVFDFIADQLQAKRPQSIPAWPLSFAAALLSLLPESLKPGRLKLLTKTRVEQYSKGYDLSGVISPAFSAIATLRFEEGMAKMLAVYQRRSRLVTP